MKCFRPSEGLLLMIKRKASAHHLLREQQKRPRQLRHDLYIAVVVYHELEFQPLHVGKVLTVWQTVVLRIHADGTLVGACMLL